MPAFMKQVNLFVCLIQRSMNQDEAITVVEIMMTAGGGNAEIVYDLCSQFIEEFPDFAELTREIFDSVYSNYESFDAIAGRLG